MEVSLNTLPKEHPDRNKPIKGCWYRAEYSKLWRQVLPSYAIADSTYNELGRAWTKGYVFSWDK